MSGGTSVLRLGVLPFVVCAALAGSPVVAAEIDHARQYGACMALAERDAQAAFDAALAWRDMGGGEGAEHCLAKALLYLKQYGEAARRFETLAQTVKAGPALKADLLDQAAQAWLLDGKAERAEAALTAALKLAPDDPGMLVDRGLARADLQWYKLALADFSRALEIDPRDADALAFRAAAHRYLDELDAAAVDAEAALTIDSENVGALIERGMVRRLKGDNAGARTDWMLVIELAPGTAAARMAQANLQRMELDPEGAKAGPK